MSLEADGGEKRTLVDTMWEDSMLTYGANEYLERTCVMTCSILGR